MLPPGSRAFAPISPANPPYQGTVSDDGGLLVLGADVWVWDPSQQAYRWRESMGEPWEFIHPMPPVGDPPVTYYVRSIIPFGSMNYIPVEIGSVS